MRIRRYQLSYKAFYMKLNHFTSYNRVFFIIIISIFQVEIWVTAKK
jgi:hypothetical protein